VDNTPAIPLIMNMLLLYTCYSIGISWAGKTLILLIFWIKRSLSFRLLAWINLALSFLSFVLRRLLRSSLQSFSLPLIHPDYKNKSSKKISIPAIAKRVGGGDMRY
jgi:hypothetical protein